MTSVGIDGAAGTALSQRLTGQGSVT